MLGTMHNIDEPYLMRDNHTFLKLDRYVEKALAQIALEYLRGDKYGMLCTKREEDPPDNFQLNGMDWKHVEGGVKVWFAEYHGLDFKYGQM
jgi:hypothetical protein